MLKSLVQRSLLAVCLAGGAAAPLLPDGAAQAQEAKVPVTVEDHLALAKTYQEKAASYRKEVAFHKQMLENYKKSVPGPSKGGQANPWAVKMQKHCQMLIKDAEKLAKDAEKSAEYHTLRAKELQGK